MEVQIGTQSVLLPISLQFLAPGTNYVPHTLTTYGLQTNGKREASSSEASRGLLGVLFLVP